MTLVLTGGAFLVFTWIWVVMPRLLLRMFNTPRELKPEVSTGRCTDPRCSLHKLINIPVGGITWSVSSS